MLYCGFVCCFLCVFFFQAEDGIRDLVRSRGLGDVYKRQAPLRDSAKQTRSALCGKLALPTRKGESNPNAQLTPCNPCLLYTSDAADERSSVDLGGRRIIKKQKNKKKEKENKKKKKTHAHIIYS